MAPPRQRLLTAFAGPWTGLVIGGLCAIAASLIATGPVAATCTLTTTRSPSARRSAEISWRSSSRGARVRGAQPECIVECEHAGGQIGEDAFEIGVGRLDGVATFFGVLPRFGQLRRHRVERLGENAELVAALHRMASAEVALRDRARAFGQKTQRPADLLGQDHGKAERGKEREQQGQGQRKRVESLQRDARKHNLLVVAVAGLHFLGVLLQLARHRLDDDARAASCATLRHIVCRGEELPAALETIAGCASRGSIS